MEKQIVRVEPFSTYAERRKARSVLSSRTVVSSKSHKCRPIDCHGPGAEISRSRADGDRHQADGAMSPSSGSALSKVIQCALLQRPRALSNRQ